MSTNLTGNQQLAYLGVEAGSPPNFRRIHRPPVSGTPNKDIKGWLIGDIWLDSSAGTPIPYMLVSKGDISSPNTPTWSAFASSGGGASDFVTDSGTATEVGGSLNVSGGELIGTIASPDGGDTLTINLDRSTDGKIIVAKTGGASAYASLTSTTLTVSGGPNTLNIEAGASLPTRFDGDSGMSTPALNIEIIKGLSGGNITTAASTNMVEIAVSGTTQYAVQVGDATGSLDSLSKGSSLQVLQSGGAAANPAWSTATYPATTAQGDVLYSSSSNVVAGLTKNASATRYLSNTGAGNNPAWAQVDVTNGVTGVLPIANGGTNASSMATTNGVNYFDGTRIVTTAVGTATHVLTSNGIGLAPTFQAAPGATGFTSVVTQVFTANGTYTPTAGMVYCIAEVVGGGGGGGGTSTTSATQVCAGGGGGGGGYAKKTLSAATIGASKAVTVGAAGTAGAAGGGNGGDGGTSSLGVLVVAEGGRAGDGAGAGSSIGSQAGVGGAGTTGDVLGAGGYGGQGAGNYNAGISFSIGGYGGNSMYGAGGRQSSANSTPGGSHAGSVGTGYGGGGGSYALSTSKTQEAGFAGTAGIVIVTEYVN